MAQIARSYPNEEAGTPIITTSREPSIVICLTSHDRIDCAKINQEIFKLNFRTPFRVVHASSGPESAPHLEDAFIRCEPKTINAGAINLIQRSLELACARFTPDYLVHLEGDAWILEEQVILDFVDEMERNPHLLLATCGWRAISPWRRIRNTIRTAITQPSTLLKPHFDLADFSTQFFIVRNDPTVLRCILDMPGNERLRAERQFFEAYSRRFNLDTVLRMRAREPVHPHNRQMCEALALYCQHWPARGTAEPRSFKDLRYAGPDQIGKKEALLRFPRIRRGESIQRLLQATSFEYYNPGASRS